MSGKKQIEGDPVVRRSITMYDQSDIPPNEYKVKASGVVLPRSTETGGIEGGGSLTVKSRTQEWDEERGTFIVTEERDVIMEGARRTINELLDKLEDSQSEVKAEVGESAPVPEEDTSPLDLSKIPPEAVDSAKLDKLLTLVEKMLVTKEASKPAPTPPAKVEKTLVRYEGYFGTIEAAYKKCIVNENCIALIRDKSADFFYSPPKDLEKEFSIELELPSGLEKMTVLNPGLEFDYSGTGETFLVLLRVS